MNIRFKDNSNKCLCTLYGHFNPITAISKLYLNQVATASSEGVIKIWVIIKTCFSTLIGICLKTFNAHKTSIRFLLCYPGYDGFNSVRLISGCCKGYNKIWEINMNRLGELNKSVIKKRIISNDTSCHCIGIKLNENQVVRMDQDYKITSIIIFDVEI